MLSAPTHRYSFLSPMKISDTKRLVRWHEPFLYSGWLQISRKIKILPLGRLFESAWYNPILKAVPMSMGILMSGNAGYAIAGNMSDNVVIVQQQTISVTGTVIDASGEPLVGVNIVEAGTVNGVISDFEGKFTLNVKPNATLKISYIGYIAQNILVKGQKNLTITLQEDTETLDEVVVVGYGTVRKADLAGSVSVLDSRNFKDQPITQVSDALQGRVAGEVKAKDKRE